MNEVRVDAIRETPLRFNGVPGFSQAHTGLL